MDMPQSLRDASANLGKRDFELVERAFLMAATAHKNQKRKDGSPYLVHPVATAVILVEWGADADTIAAGLLHDSIEDSDLEVKDIQKDFNPIVARLVEGVTKFTKADFAGKESLDDSIETLRKLFEVMREDMRVVIIKLADRLHNLRTIEGLSVERRKTFAKETLDIYYKLTHYLSINELRREISDICVPYVYPEFAKKREMAWKMHKSNTEQAVSQIQEKLQDMVTAGTLLEMKVVRRAHDVPVQFVREEELAEKAYYCVAIVKDIDSCYTLFKQLHGLYRPLRQKFHDYIAAAPETGYRSLHTTVIAPNNEPIQFRIRTQEMDTQIQHGVLLESFQKNNVDGDPATAFWLERAEQADRSTRENSDAFWSALQSDIFQKVFSVTIDGKPLSVPINATVLDAAYLQYGSNANRTLKVLVNGIERELSTELQEEDVITIKFGERLGVTFSWLQYVSTQYAHNHIVDVLKERDRGEKLSLGQILLQREFDLYKKGIVGALSKQQQQSVIQHFKCDIFNDVLVMVGDGSLLASDVLFALFPEKGQGGDMNDRGKAYYFDIRFLVPDRHRSDVLAQVSTLARLNDTLLVNTKLKSGSGNMLTVHLRGVTKNRHHFAEFLASLERHSWISSIQTLLSFKKRIFLWCSLLLTFVVMLVGVIFLPYYEAITAEITVVPRILLDFISIAPILLMNGYLLFLLRNYLVHLRNDRLFLGLGCVLNFFAFLIILVRTELTSDKHVSVLPLMAVFVVFTCYLGYRFYQTDAIFFSGNKTKRLSAKQWKKLRKKKNSGYFLRLVAVCIWGAQPLYLKYTPINEVEPFLRVLFTGIGALLISAIIIAFRQVLLPKVRRKINKKMPKNILFYNIIISYILFTYFLNASLQFTTSTNFILFNSFSPVLALMVALLLWRSSIPYLKNPRHMLWIFVVFLLGSTGSMLVIYNSASLPSFNSLRGDIFALLAMLADTVLVVSQIRYMKLYSTSSSILLNFYVFIFHILAILPIVAYFLITGNSAVTELTMVQIYYGIGAGLFTGIGQMLNYETFRRVDGYIAFLMFNISILIAFATEVFFLSTVTPTAILIFGGILIIGSTVTAEAINTYCQKRGM